MGIRVIGFVLCLIVHIQACTRPNALHQIEKLPCAVKLRSYQNITNYGKKQYDEYYEKMKKEKLDANLIRKLELHHRDFEQRISQLLSEYKKEIETLQGTPDKSERVELCRSYIERARKANPVIIGLIDDIKAELKEVIEKAGLPPPKKESLKKMLNRCLNMFFLLDLAAHIGNDLIQFWNWLNDRGVENGIPEKLLESHQSNVQEFVQRLEDMVDDELSADEIGTEAAETVRGQLSEFLEHLQSGGESRTIEAIRAAEAAKESEAAKSAEALRAVEIAKNAKEANTAELTQGARNAESTRAAEAIRTAEATREADTARLSQSVRVAQTFRSAQSARIANTVEAFPAAESNLAVGGSVVQSTSIFSVIASYLGLIVP